MYPAVLFATPMDKSAVSDSNPGLDWVRNGRDWFKSVPEPSAYEFKYSQDLSQLSNIDFSCKSGVISPALVFPLTSYDTPANERYIKAVLKSDPKTPIQAAIDLENNVCRGGSQCIVDPTVLSSDAIGMAVSYRCFGNVVQRSVFRKYQALMNEAHAFF